MDRTWLYAGIIIAGGVALSRALSGPTLKRGQRLLLFGDSLSVGLATPMGALAKDNGVLFDAVGQVGSTVSMWSNPTSKLGSALTQKLALKPDIVLCSLGTNDEALVLASAQKEVPELEALIAQVKASGAHLAWIGPPKFLPCLSFQPNGFTAAVRQRIPSADYFASEQYDIPRGGDCLHPTVKGYAGWAGQIWQWMRCCPA